MQTIIEKFRRQGLTADDAAKIINVCGDDTNAFCQIAARRLSHEPWAYILGECYFFGRRFKVDRRVYVPNPETENLVELALKLLKPGMTVADIGTGSGVIAITIKKELPSVEVCGVDIDPAALIVASENAALHNADICFKTGYYANEIGFPDLIVADMPYGDKNYLLPSSSLDEFRHLPPLAIFHHSGTLAAYEELIASVKPWPKKSKIIIETGLVPKSEVIKIIPKLCKWDYHAMENYSVTEINLF